MVQLWFHSELRVAIWYDHMAMAKLQLWVQGPHTHRHLQPLI